MIKYFYRNFGRVSRLFLSFLVGILFVFGEPRLTLFPFFMQSSSVLAKENVTIPLLQQGKMLYDAGRFAEAVEVLKQAAAEYKQKGDELKLAATLSNLSLAYQQLGALTEAQQAITDSLKLLQNSQNLPVLAQSLEIQGRLQLKMGQPEMALASWQKATALYQQAKNYHGVVRSQINQAQAWRAQGFYHRAIKMLKATNQQLQSQPDSIEKAVGLRSLGDALTVSGDLQMSQKLLQQSLAIAQRLKSSGDIAASFFSLANNARKQQKTQDAATNYQQAIELATSPLAKIQAQLNYLSLLAETKQLAQAKTLLSAIPSQLEQLPLSRAKIYAQINFAQSLMKLGNSPKKPASESDITNPVNIAQILVNAVKQSRSLGDRRTEAHALLCLGNLYEENQQLVEAQNVTQQGLILAQSAIMPDVAYRLQWQLGRLLRKQDHFTGAIAAYDAALDTLKSIRRDLATINQDVQFNFRDSVEPIYRESVELLLRSQAATPNPKILDKTRQRIEALQLAELDNFFQEACLEGQNVLLDQVVDKENPTTAIFYPIILPKQLQVIVKIPNQPLQYYGTNVLQAEVEKVVTELRAVLVNPTATRAVKTQSQIVYNWLIKPIESQLSANKVDTLVFVLDGVLRNIPIGSLYDGKKYLIENYAIAASVGLQLQNPQALVKQQLKALVAGLTEPPSEFSDLVSLPAVKSELQLISSTGISTTSLLDQEFTRNTLEKRVNAAPFNVVHIATHGQFSSMADKTFILAADGPINVKQFDSLLRSRAQNQPKALELLVLSACETASGDKHAALGLAGAAIRAGARSTVASLWHIDDESTASFIGDFYRELKNGKLSKAQAVRNAQLQMLRHPNFKAPSFWSAYVLIGNWL